MNTEFNTPELKEMAGRLLNLGYRIFVHKPTSAYPKVSYFHYGNENGLAYIQQSNQFRAMSLSSVHKPHRNVGTGYGIEEYLNIDADAKVFADAITFKFQNWDAKNGQFVTKYKNIDEYVNSDSYNQKTYVEYKGDK